MSYLNTLPVNGQVVDEPQKVNIDIEQIESSVSEHKERFGNGYDPLDTDAGKQVLRELRPGPISAPLQDLTPDEWESVSGFYGSWKSNEAEAKRYTEQGNIVEAGKYRAMAEDAKRGYMQDPVKALQYLSGVAKQNVPDKEKYSAFENELIAAGQNNPSTLLEFRAASMYDRKPEELYKGRSFIETLATTYEMFKPTTHLSRGMDLSVARENASQEEYATDKEIVEGVPEGFHSYLLGIAAEDGDYAALMAKDQVMSNVSNQEEFDEMPFMSQLGYGALAYLLMPETYITGGLVGMPVKAGVAAVATTGLGVAAKTGLTAGVIGIGGGVEEAILATPRLANDQTYTPNDFMVDVAAGTLFTGGLAAAYQGVARAVDTNANVNAAHKKTIEETKAKQEQYKDSPRIEPQSSTPDVEEAIVNAQEFDDIFRSVLDVDELPGVPTITRADGTEVYNVEAGVSGTSIKSPSIVQQTQKDAPVKKRKYTTVAEVTKLSNKDFNSVLKIARQVHNKDSKGKTTPIGFLLNSQKGLINKQTSTPELEPIIQELNATIAKIAIAFPSGKVPPSIQGKISDLSRKQVTLATDNVMARLLGGLEERGGSTVPTAINQDLLEEYSNFLMRSNNVPTLETTTQEFLKEFEPLLYGQGIDIKKVDQTDMDDAVDLFDGNDGIDVEGTDLNPEDLAGVETDIPVELSELRDIIELNKRYPDSEALRNINGVVAQRLRQKVDSNNLERYKDSTVRFAKKVQASPDEVKARVLDTKNTATLEAKAASKKLLSESGKEVQARFKKNGISMKDIVQKNKDNQKLTDAEKAGWEFYLKQRKRVFEELQRRDLPLPTVLSSEDKAIWEQLQRTSKKVSEDVQLVGRTPEDEIRGEVQSDVDRDYDTYTEQYAGNDVDTEVVRELKASGKYLDEKTINNIISQHETILDKKLTPEEHGKLFDELTVHGMDAIPTTIPEGQYQPRIPEEMKDGVLVRQRNLEQGLIPRSMTRVTEVNAFKDPTVASLKELNTKLKKEVLDKLEINKLLRAGEEVDFMARVAIDEAIKDIQTQGLDKTLNDLYETKDVGRLADILVASKTLAKRNAKLHRNRLEAEKRQAPKSTEGVKEPAQTEPKQPSKEEILAKPLDESDVTDAINGVLDETRTADEVVDVNARLLALNEKLQQESLNKLKNHIVKFVSSGRSKIQALASKPATRTDYVGRLAAAPIKELADHFLLGDLETLKFVGGTLTETAHGFGGQIKRQDTAGLLKERNGFKLKALYARPYNDAISEYVAAQGRGKTAQWMARWGEATNNKHVAQFDRDFWRVIEYKRQGKEIPPSIHNSVVKFVDKWQKFTDEAHDMAVKSNVAGFHKDKKVRFYVPHVWVQGKFKAAIKNHGVDKVREVLILAYRTSKEAGTSFVSDPIKMADELIQNVMDESYDAADLYSPVIEGNLSGKDARAKRRVDLDTTTEIDGLSILDLLDTEVINVANKYSNRIAGYSAIAEATDGALTSPRDITNLKDIMRREGIKKNVSTQKQEKLYDDVIDMLLGRPPRGGLPQEIRQLKQLAMLSKLGGLGLAQATETGQVLTKAVMSMFSDRKMLSQIAGMAMDSPEHVELMRDVEALSYISKDVDLFHRDSTNYDYSDMEDISHARQLSKYIVDKVTGGQLRAPASRALTQGSMYNAIKRSQLQVAQSSFLLDAAKHFKYGTGKMSNARRADVGLTEPDGTNALLADVFNNIVEYKDGRPVKLNLDKWPPEAREEFGKAMFRDAGQTVQMAMVGELPAWLNSPMWGLVMQFRTFGLLSMNKQLRRSMAFADQQAVYDTLLNTASAAVVRYAKFATLGTAMALVTGKDDPEDYWKSNISQMAMHKYVAQFGIYPDAIDLAMDMKDIERPGEAWDLLQAEIPVLGVAHDYITLATTDNSAKRLDALHGLTPLGNMAFGDLFYGVMEEQLLNE